MSGAGLGVRVAPSAAIATARSAASAERSSKRSCDTRMPLMLRTRSPSKAAILRISASKLAAALEVEIAPHGEDALVTVALHQVQRRRAAEAPVGRDDPAVRKIAIVRKQDAQRLVDAE